MSLTVSATDVLAGLDFDGPAPPRWLPGEPFNAIDVRPGRVIVIGAPPAAGKTALIGQLTTQLLQLNPELTLLTCNVEMTPTELLLRQLSRLSGVELSKMTDRTMTPEERKHLNTGRETGQAVFERMHFLKPPFHFGTIKQAVKQHESELVVIDYIQRFAPSPATDATKNADSRRALDLMMNEVREVATWGACVFVISAVARQKSASGASGYGGLNMASLRGSSELEYGADSAYLLTRERRSEFAIMECVKNRNGEEVDIPLRFSGAVQLFTKGEPFDGFDDAVPLPTKGKKL